MRRRLAQTVAPCASRVTIGRLGWCQLWRDKRHTKRFSSDLMSRKSDGRVAMMRFWRDGPLAIGERCGHFSPQPRQQICREPGVALAASRCCARTGAAAETGAGRRRRRRSRRTRRRSRQAVACGGCRGGRPAHTGRPAGSAGPPGAAETPGVPGLGAFAAWRQVTALGVVTRKAEAHRHRADPRDVVECSRGRPPSTRAGGRPRHRRTAAHWHEHGFPVPARRRLCECRR